MCVMKIITDLINSTQLNLELPKCIMKINLIFINSPASTIKAIDHYLHCYHFYGNNASRFIVPYRTNKVKKKLCGPFVSFSKFLKLFITTIPGRWVDGNCDDWAISV